VENFHLNVIHPHCALFECLLKQFYTTNTNRITSYLGFVKKPLSFLLLCKGKFQWKVFIKKNSGDELVTKPKPLCVSCIIVFQ
jgi:hypothetical protein